MACSRQSHIPQDVWCTHFSLLLSQKQYGGMLCFFLLSTSLMHKWVCFPIYTEHISWVGCPSIWPRTHFLFTLLRDCINMRPRPTLNVVWVVGSQWPSRTFKPVMTAVQSWSGAPETHVRGGSKQLVFHYTPVNVTLSTYTKYCAWTHSVQTHPSFAAAALTTSPVRTYYFTCISAACSIHWLLKKIERFCPLSITTHH